MKIFLILQYLEKYIIQYNSWPPGAGIEGTGKKSYGLEEGEEVGDGKQKGHQQ